MGIYLDKHGHTNSLALSLFLPWERITTRNVRLGDILCDDFGASCVTKIENNGSDISLLDPLGNGTTGDPGRLVTIIDRRSLVGTGAERVQHAMGEAWMLWKDRAATPATEGSAVVARLPIDLGSFAAGTPYRLAAKAEMDRFIPHGGKDERAAIRSGALTVIVVDTPLGGSTTFAAEATALHCRIIDGVLFTRGLPSPEEIAANEAEHGDKASTDAKPLTCAWLVIHDSPGPREPKVSIAHVFMGPPFEGDGADVVWMMATGLTTHFRAVPDCGRWPVEAWWTPLSWRHLPVRHAPKT